MRTLTVILLLASVSCGGDDPCGEPGYGGVASDEAWRTMVDGEARTRVGDPEAVTITAPAEGEVVASAPRITWTSPLRKPHLPPVTSDIYLLGIAVPGRACPVEMLTTEPHWQLDAAQWAALRAAAGQTVSLQVTSAYLKENRITEGPFRPEAPRTFVVAP
jgi:hypothetical protein